MIVAIHQPNFIPWTGYFYKIFCSDVFVILDDVQYTKNSFINRNRIKTPSGEQWLTVPVLHSGNFGQNINQVVVLNPSKFYSKIKSTLRMNYIKSPYFSEVFGIIEPLLDSEPNISLLNESIIRAFAIYLKFPARIIKSSEINGIEGESTERLVNICLSLGASEYLAGFGSKKYQDSDIFASKGINTGIYNFKHPVYSQLWGEFIPNLSFIDLLFNAGPDTIKYIEAIKLL